ncbi:MAG TPA: DegT/DnrJ/EryC1/StrS family aminotransferase [Bryobacteraceae bacterium]|nr:DegT/DnrJ/EryC1/StrS family aminotransferase [Bryobacteraceae bacterium]HPT25501.1 DegT/DnrJ/EryC1/StrS family aminotransferase [Bryobacteraceae bacterium]
MSTVDRAQELAIHGGSPVRTLPLPLEFPGVHFMDREEEDAVLRVVRSRSPFRFYGMDLRREAAGFEQEFAAMLGVRHAVAVGSGTGALHVALGALGVGPGQEVIVPAYLWVSIIAAVVNRGAIPVFADIDQTFCLDPADVARKITPRTSGIVMVHMSGTPGNVPEVLKVARAHNLFLVEDCAQCAGGSIGGRKVGAFGDMAIFSFQMNKNMTSGEGGCVVTDDLRLHRRAVACHDLGYPRNDEGRMMFDLPDIQLWGLGCRMDEMRAALLRVQLRKLPRIVAAMRGSKYRIRAALEKFTCVTLRSIQDPAGDTGCFLITTYRDAATAQKARDALRAEGIRTAPQGVSNILMTEWGLHLYYNNLSLLKRASVDGKGFPWNLPANSGSPVEYGKGLCPVADSLFERSVLLAIPSCLTTKDEDDIISAFEKVLPAVESGSL